MDWAACVICRTDTKEKFRCPLNAFGGDKSQAYSQFLHNVKTFRQLGKLLVELIFDDNITTEDFTLHKAQWHKSCWFKFSINRLERAQQNEMLKKQAHQPVLKTLSGRKLEAIQLSQRTFVFSVQKQKAIFMISQLCMQMQIFDVWLLTYRILHCWQELQVET